MSVRLTLRLRAEQQYVIDCGSETLDRVEITLELADDMRRPDDSSVLQGNGARADEDKAEDARVMANARHSVEAQKGCSGINSSWQDFQRGVNGLTGHGQLSINRAALY